MAFPASRKVCVICARSKADYRCPTCNAPYCSLACYKTHDERCTEGFYASNVKENLGLLSGTQDTTHGVEDEHGQVDKAKVMQMLKRDAELRDKDGTGEDAGLVEGGAKGSCAGAEDDDDDVGAADEPDGDRQRRAFLRAVNSGSIFGGEESAAISRWAPWWAEAAVKGIQAHSASEHCYLSKLLESSLTPSSSPSSASPLQPLSALVRARPPEGVLANNLVSILLSYCHVQRLYLGDWHDEDPCELAGLLMALSPVLAEDARFTDEEAGVLMAFQAYRELLGRDPSLRHYEATGSRDSGNFALLASTLVTLRDVVTVLRPNMLAVGPDEGDATGRLPPLSPESTGAGLCTISLIEEADEASAGSNGSSSLARHLIMDALLHMESVLGGAIASASASALESGDAGEPNALQERASKRAKAALAAAARKVHFFACWANDCDGTEPWGLSRAGLAALVRKACSVLEEQQLYLEEASRHQEASKGTPEKLKLKQVYGEWKRGDEYGGSSIFKQVSWLKADRKRAVMGGRARITVVSDTAPASSDIEPAASSSIVHGEGSKS